MVIGCLTSERCGGLFVLDRRVPSGFTFRESVAFGLRPSRPSSVSDKPDTSRPGLRNERISAPPVCGSCSAVKGWTKIAILASTDATGQDVDNNMAQMLALPENKSVTVVAHEHYNASDVSVAAQIARIKNSGAQAMIAWTVGGPLATPGD